MTALLSLQQERLVELEARAPEYQRYHRQYAVLELEGALDAAALQAALTDLRQRHSSLRFRLAQTQPPRARFDLAAAVELAAVELSELSDEAALEQVIEEAVAPYDFAEGPLCRARLYRRGEARHWLLIAAHHVVFDYWSMGLIVEDLSRGYALHLQGVPRLKVAPAPQPSDYALWQRSEAFAQMRERQAPFWRTLLAKPGPRAELVFYPWGEPVEAYAPLQLRVSVPEAITAAVWTFSKSKGLTPYMILLAGFALTLRYFGAPARTMVAAPVSGRTHPEWSRLVAFLSGVMPLPFDLGGNASIDDFLAQVRRTVMGAIANQDVQFQDFEALAGGPLHYQYMFQLQNAPMPDFDLGGLAVRPVRVDYGIEYLDMSLCLTQSPVMSGDHAGVSGYLTVNRNLIAEAHAWRCWDVFLRLLSGLTQQAATTLDSLIEEVRCEAR